MFPGPRIQESYGNTNTVTSFREFLKMLCINTHIDVHLEKTLLAEHLTK